MAAAAARGKAEEAEEGVGEEDDPYQTHQDECFVCRGKGRLVCCDACPCAFHPKCAGLSRVPQGEWRCPACGLAAAGAGARHVAVGRAKGAPLVVSVATAERSEVDGLAITAYAAPKPAAKGSAARREVDARAAKTGALRRLLQLPEFDGLTEAL